MAIDGLNRGQNTGYIPQEMTSNPRQIDAWVSSLHKQVNDVLQKIGSNVCKPNGDGLMPCETNVRECLTSASHLLARDDVKSHLSISSDLCKKVNSKGNPFLESLKKLCEHVQNGIDAIDHLDGSVIRKNYQEGTVKKAIDLLSLFS